MSGWIDASHINDFEVTGGLPQRVVCNGGPEVVTLSSISDFPLSGQVVIKLPRHPNMKMAIDSGQSSGGGS